MLRPRNPPLSLLTPSALSPLALQLLPSSSSSPALNAPIEAVALLVHSIHTSLGFRLVSPSPPSSSSESDSPETKNALPQGWTNNGSPRFKYRHEQSALEFDVSVQELGGRAVVSAVAVQDHKSLSFDFLLTDYLSASSFPFSRPSDTSSDTSASLTTLFASPARLTDLITLYRINIIQKLVPGLVKPGYEELSDSTATGSGRRDLGTTEVWEEVRGCGAAMDTFQEVLYLQERGLILSVRLVMDLRSPAALGSVDLEVVLGSGASRLDRDKDKEGEGGNDDEWRNSMFG
ncbi:hypothetical protein MNV49_000473 [Pseudohyphozyma bogoriensis]|nr:hypothetical protein MNV49_000473 [Pseudohyphozyma bogoriensis]